MRTGAPFGPPAITRPFRTSTSPPCVGSGVACRSSVSTSSPSGRAIVTVARTRRPSVILAVEEMRGDPASVPIERPRRSIRAWRASAIRRSSASFPVTTARWSGSDVASCVA